MRYSMHNEHSNVYRRALECVSSGPDRKIHQKNYTADNNILSEIYIFLCLEGLDIFEGSHSLHYRLMNIRLCATACIMNIRMCIVVPWNVYRRVLECVSSGPDLTIHQKTYALDNKVLRESLFFLFLEGIATGRLAAKLTPPPTTA